ncbi:MAG TPA: tetratricopeptide repeat protein [Novimethylophilus sp.]|jgi:hypothetical protein|uniref:tetratricopeptide repeat protein n=1 Tax=Novimethylophilus sp. TaxID=2137426 RepID=UPI002F42FB31
MQRLLLMLMLSMAAAAQGADETFSTNPAQGSPKADSPADAAQPQAPKAEPPKKTEYDKLPLPRLLAKANANDVTAQFELASRFSYGQGLPKNTDEALRWLRRAAGAGQQDAARLLAVKLYNGYDVTADFTEALRWAHMLADKGDLPGQLMLANMYANGEGTARDLVQAYMWYAIAAAGGKRDDGKDEPREEQLQAAMDQRDKLAGLLTQEQEAQAQKLASDWWLSKYVPKPAVKSKTKSKKKPAAPGKPA